ncbi:XdhC family protein [Conexibacter woesei]|uniref:Uncharacterized protein n=1 Tax=Conexibacter woesei (strain DSM 14684 / CCUG 47730 / CIP 108061 / JCM 11494 / NBRC 100937 / ID131577) TaxID=469383 RepID=D3FCT5_CONWI|nr:XdhC family protein [Conexibacter woesei]ADB51447.1 protein of unknown function DUF182 [Conexibacter woesei DSM 14684]
MIAGSLARAAQRMRAGGEPFVHATVVRAQHPTSVHAGDAALVHADGTIEGFVGGHCAQASVRLHAARVLETGEPLLLRIVPEAVADVEESIGGIVVEHNHCLSGGAFEIFLEPWRPAPRMVVVGDAPTARALAELARAAGWEAALVAADAVARPQPRDEAFVVASHGEGEERALCTALTEGVPYVGLVASRRRGEAVRAALDVPDELRARLHVPAGLAIGARTPGEVAIAILAQLIAERQVYPGAAEPEVAGAER